MAERFETNTVLWAFHTIQPSSLLSAVSATGCRPTLRTSQQTWAVRPPVGCYQPHHRRHLLLLLSPKADTHLGLSYRRRESERRWRCTQVGRNEIWMQDDDRGWCRPPRRPAVDTVDGRVWYRRPDTGEPSAAPASRRRRPLAGRRRARAAPRAVDPTPDSGRTSSRRSGARRRRTGRRTAARRRRAWQGRSAGRRSTRDRRTSDERASWWSECTGSRTGWSSAASAWPPTKDRRLYNHTDMAHYHRTVF